MEKCEQRDERGSGDVERTRVVFLHPDLGIGGAERLVVDAALALHQRCHDIAFITGHHDPQHSFPETNDGRFPVLVVGDWLPRSLLGRCYALCAYVRMIYIALYLVLASNLRPHIVIVDQVSACIPVLRIFARRTPVIFYCHFPDQLLSARRGWLKSVYRKPIDWLEERTTGMASKVLVNSNFTASVYGQTFPSLRSHHPPLILYPSLNMDMFDQAPSSTGEPAKPRTSTSKPRTSTSKPRPSTSNQDPDLDEIIPASASKVFLSINRYERKKNIELALRAFALLPPSPTTHLVVAGGYDPLLPENVSHYEELVSLADSLGLSSRSCFLRSPSDSLKIRLLRRAACLLYTPSSEHFGIVPLEAMYMRCPVIAVNSGGPLETVEDGRTGFLCEPNPESFAEKMETFVTSDENGAGDEMGPAGRERVVKYFSFQAFSKKLEQVVQEVLAEAREKSKMQ